jgi:hypothetical protein
LKAGRIHITIPFHCFNTLKPFIFCSPSMADPLVIVGAAASVPGVVEILDKAASTLHELYNHWKELKEADFIPINFIAPTPFIALESALGRLQEWMNTDMDEPHHQLVMDL